MSLPLQTTCHHTLDMGQQECSKCHYSLLLQSCKSMTSDLNSFTDSSSPYESPHHISPTSTSLPVLQMTYLVSKNGVWKKGYSGSGS